VKARHRYARGVVYLALAVFLVATLIGAIVVARAALQLMRRRARLDEVVASSNALVERAQEVAASAAHVRAETDRLRALTRVQL
jgi:hypothetical protein